MKIGVLTFHEIFNPGAYLQVYATRATLTSLGHEVHIINYTSPRHRFNPWRKLFLHPRSCLLNLRNWLETFKRNAAFSAVQHLLNPTRRLKTHQDLANAPFDGIIIGADIVWHYQHPVWGDDPVYFGKHTNCRKCLVAYAPSCGSLNLNTKIPDFVVEGLQKFHAIAVRDNRTAEMVYYAIGKRVPVIMDPTFDLDITNISDSPKVPTTKYLFVYAFESLLSEQAQRQICQFAESEGVKIVAACYRHHWADINVIDANPFDWIALLKNAEWVFTNTFHGTIFSAKLSKQFAVECNRIIKPKIDPVLKNLDIQNRVFSASSDLKKVLKTPYDIKKVSSRIQSCAAQGREYLAQALAM